MHKIHRAEVNQFNITADGFERGTEENINKAIAHYREQLETRIRQVNDAKSKTAVQFREEMDSIAGLERRLEGVKAKLKGFHSSPATNQK